MLKLKKKWRKILFNMHSKKNLLNFFLTELDEIHLFRIKNENYFNYSFNLDNFK